MTRIFSTLAVCSLLALGAAFWLGWRIGDARLHESAVQTRVAIHFLAGVAALVFALLIHALVITYFMGTGRWLEETTTAYRLPGDWQARSRDLKWRLYPAIVVSLALLILTGALGAAADPASAVGFQGIGSFTAAHVHLGIAIATLLINAAVNVWEYRALSHNGQLVNEVLEQVRRIRTERGLDV
jgi:hypothetical protein